MYIVIKLVPSLNFNLRRSQLKYMKLFKKHLKKKKKQDLKTVLKHAEISKAFYN